MGVHQLPPPPVFGGACPHALAVDSGFFVVFVFIDSNGGYEATPLQVVRVPLSVGRSIPHQRGRQMLSFLLTWGVLTCVTPPLLGLALPTMTQFHEWLHSSWGSLSASINRHCCYSLHLTCMFLPSSHIREALLVGCQVTALPLFSCDILFLSPLAEVVLHGVGLVHLSHA